MIPVCLLLLHQFVFQPFSWFFYLYDNPKSPDQVLEKAENSFVYTYLDDSAGADSVFSEAQRVSDMVWEDVRRSGFVANDVKSQWVQAQSRELSGYVLNLCAGTFQAHQRRV